MLSNMRFTSTIALLSLLLVACDIHVGGEGKDKKVDIKTAFGDVSVRTDETGVDTGLPVYPGATPARGHDEETESANVNVSTAFVGVRVAAAKYESNDAPQAIVDFYKEKLSTYGAVVECKGDIEFEGEPKQPICEEESSSDETQLVTGTEDNHRLVAVKARKSGAEFALVSIQIGKSGEGG